MDCFFSSLSSLSQVLAALSQLDRSSFGSKKTCGRIHSHLLPSLDRFILKLVFSLIFTLLRETLIGRKPYLGMTQHYPTLLNISKLPHPNCYGRAHRRLMSKTRKYVWLGRSHIHWVRLLRTQTRRACNQRSALRTWIPACHAVKPLSIALWKHEWFEFHIGILL